MYISRWRSKKHPTALAPHGLKCFDGFVPNELYQYALEISTRGVLHKGGGRKPVRFQQNPYSSINDKAEITASALWGDVVNGRIIFASAGGGFSGL